MNISLRLTLPTLERPHRFPEQPLYSCGVGVHQGLEEPSVSVFDTWPEILMKPNDAEVLKVNLSLKLYILN